MKNALDILSRTAFLGLIWFGLNGLDHASWIVGAPCALVAALTSFRMRSQHALRLSPIALTALAVYFVWNSLRGGIDVAQRVLNSRMAMNPGYYRHTHRLPAGTARRFFEMFLNTMPGTLSANSSGHEVLIHCIHEPAEMIDNIHRTELRVARAFCTTLESASA